VLAGCSLHGIFSYISKPHPFRSPEMEHSPIATMPQFVVRMHRCNIKRKCDVSFESDPVHRRKWANLIQCSVSKSRSRMTPSACQPPPPPCTHGTGWYEASMADEKRQALFDSSARKDEPAVKLTLASPSWDQLGWKVILLHPQPLF
jgi:hypothetical protein